MYQLKDYNNRIVYILLLLLITTGSAGSAFYLRGQLLEAFRIPVASNYPTILPGDRILANKIAYKSSDPKRGDLIVFINPANRRQNYIKRIVGLPGDTVEIRDNVVYINDRKLEIRKLDDSSLDKIRIKIQGKLLEGDVYEETNVDAKYKILLAKPPHDKTSPDFAQITVPKHHCFVLGDNRNNSFDSRNFGAVPLATIKGRADYLYWCAKDWSRFGRLN